MTTEQNNQRRGRARVVVNEDQAKEVVERLKSGEARTLIDESQRLGFGHNGILRAALRARLGREGYAALMSGVMARSRRRKPKQDAA